MKKILSTLILVFAGASMQTQATPEIVALHLQKEALTFLPYPKTSFLVKHRKTGQKSSITVK